MKRLVIWARRERELRNDESIERERDTELECGRGREHAVVVAVLPEKRRPCCSLAASRRGCCIGSEKVNVFHQRGLYYRHQSSLAYIAFFSVILSHLKTYVLPVGLEISSLMGPPGKHTLPLQMVQPGQTALVSSPPFMAIFVRSPLFIFFFFHLVCDANEIITHTHAVHCATVQLEDMLLLNAT